MKHILYIAIFLMGLGSIQAQSTIMVDQKVVKQTVYKDSLTIVNSFYRSRNGDGMKSTWKRISLDLPFGWDYSLCDNGNCYVGIPQQSSSPHTFAKDERGFLSLKVNPSGSYGNGTLKILIYEVGKPEQGDTATWFITSADQASSIADQKINTLNISLYPNPASNILHIQGLNSNKNQVAIYNMAGQLLMQQDNVQAHNAMINVSNLPANIYLLKVTDAKGQVYNKSFPVVR